MPVIGRLDGQVNDVLIDPIGRQRRREASNSPTPSDAAHEEAMVEEARAGSPGPRDENARGDEGARGHDAEQLPVWLL